MPRGSAGEGPGAASGTVSNHPIGAQGPSQSGRTQKSTSDARKLQNRISSKKYREKRKQKLETLRNLEQVLVPLINDDQIGGSPAASAENAGVNVLGDFLPGTESSKSVSAPAAADFMNEWDFGDIFSTPQFTETLNSYAPDDSLLQTPSNLSSSFVPELDLQMPDLPSTTRQLDSWLSRPHLPDAGASSEIPQPSSADLPTEQYPNLANISDRKPQTRRISAAKFVTYASKLTVLERQRAGTISMETGIRLLDLLCGGIEACLGPQALTAEESTNVSKTEMRKLRGNAFLDRGLPTYLSSQTRLKRSLSTGIPYVADIHINNIRINHVSLFAAMWANARALGHDYGDYLDEDSISPLCLTEDAGNDQIEMRSRRYATNPKDLRPTATQIRQPHHLYIDLIPFPTFRERLITAAYSDPPLIDECELCVDLHDDGLICYGTAKGGVGIPWDMRSWEPQVWFLEKYWFLVGDKDGDMWSSARWWQSLRGEDE